MRSVLRKLEVIQAATAPAGADAVVSAQQRRAQEAEREKRLAKLSPYRRSAYACLECIEALREALRDCKDAEDELNGIESSGRPASPSPNLEPGAGADGDDAQQQQQEESRKRMKLTASDMNRRAFLQQHLARSRQAARRSHQQLQKLHREAQAARARSAQQKGSSSSNGRRPAGDRNGDADAEEADDFRRLTGHVENARRWYREAFQITVVSSSDDPLLVGARGEGGRWGEERAPLLDGGGGGDGLSDERVRPPPRGLQDLFRTTSYPTAKGGSGGGREGASSPSASPNDGIVEYRNAREEAEFVQFFQSVREKDELMDQALDRVAASVHRIHENALGLQSELAVQATLLDQTEAAVDRNQESLEHMNRRLRYAIRDMEDSSICSYVLCLLTLLLVLGLLIRVAG